MTRNDTIISQNIIKNILRAKIFWLIIILLFLFIVFYEAFFVYIQPNEMGLKQVNISLTGKPGLKKDTYYTGWHFKLPIIQEYITFPKDLLVYDLMDNRSSRSRGSFFYQSGSSALLSQISRSVPESRYMRQGAANIQTNDGFYVRVDVTIIYRVIDPYKVATVLGRTPKEFWQNGIARKAESVLKDSFGKLTTEEFYNSPMRVQKAKEAKELFNTKIAREGLKVEHVLVRYFVYSDEIQKNIEEKKLKDQLVFRNQSEGRAAIEGAKLKKVEEEGKATVKVELEKGNAYVVRKNAERDAYMRKKKAAGDLLIKLAEAKKTKLINDAYLNKGAARLVGLEMAKVLEGVELIVIPSDGKNGVNPLDLNKMIRLFKVGNK